MSVKVGEKVMRSADNTGTGGVLMAAQWRKDQRGRVGARPRVMARAAVVRRPQFDSVDRSALCLPQSLVFVSNSLATTHIVTLTAHPRIHFIAHVTLSTHWRAGDVCTQHRTIHRIL